MVNLSFSCEITLKLLYEYEKEQVAQGHLLYQNLYVTLSTEMQETILKRTVSLMNKKAGFDKYTRNDFLDNLKQSDNVFVEERYDFEYIPGTKSNSVLPLFMTSFSHVLLKINYEKGLNKPVKLSSERIKRINEYNKR